MEKLYAEYGEDRNPELYNNMGGEIRREVYIKARDRARNACALKLCLALEKAGFYIPDVPNSLKGRNGRNYFVSAGFFYEFLENSYSDCAHYYSSPNALKAQMSQGIYYQNGGWRGSSITGHIDAMYKGMPGGKVYNNQPLNVGFY